jgi:hypothetical protein
MAQNFHQTDDRQGNAYTFADVVHVTGTATTFSVDQSVISVTHSPSNGQTQIVLTTNYTLGTASGGLKVVTITSGTASGTYTLIMRSVGSAAGIGSSKIAV